MQTTSRALRTGQLRHCCCSYIGASAGSLALYTPPSHLRLASRSFQTSGKMSSALTSALLNATVGSPATAGAQPHEVTEKKHHNRHGKGFVNPWDSYLERSAWEMISKMGWRAISGKRNVCWTLSPYGRVDIWYPVWGSGIDEVS